MFDSFLDGSNVNFLVALLAGFITFFASCLLPLVPTYLAYLSGVSLNSDSLGERLRIMRVALFFVIGFITTFIVLSLAINILNGLVTPFRFFIEKLSGLIFIVLGLFMFGVFKHKLFTQERRFDLRKLLLRKKGFDLNRFILKHRNLHALITGIAFGFAWTPCIGPVLAVILYWSSHTGSTLSGVLLLIAYGIGLGIPFLIVAAGFEKIIPLLKKYSYISNYVSYLSGTIIILSGVLMITGNFQALSLMIVKLFNLRALSI